MFPLSRGGKGLGLCGLCVLGWGGQLGFGWQSVGPGLGDAPMELYIYVNFQPQIAHKAL